MKINKVRLAFAGILFSTICVYSNMVTRTYKAGFFFKGVVVPLRLMELGLLGIVIAIFIASLIESKVINRVLDLAYKKIFSWVFFANTVIAFVQWIASISIDSIFVPLYIKHQYDSIISSVMLLVPILFLITVFCFKMVLQYILIRRLNLDINHLVLKKSILYANLISFGVLCLLELISFYIPTTVYV